MTNPSIDMHSTELGKLLEALAKAQAIMQGAVQDSANPFFKSTYADLTSVWEACRGPLTQNGLSVVQTIQVCGDTTCLVSILGHISGQWIKSLLPIKPSKPDIQSLGSAITYCRRYALSALVGVCPVDDDGESAMDRGQKHSKAISSEPVIRQFKLPPTISENAFQEFVDESAKASNNSIDSIIKRANQNPEGFLKALKVWEESRKENNLEMTA